MVILKLLDILGIRHFMNVLNWTIISLSFLTFSFSNALAEKKSNIEKLEEWKENEWILESIIEGSVHASVNGKITHGDRLRIRFLRGNCNLPNMLASFYTILIPREKLILEGKILNATFFNPKFFNYRMRVKVIHETPFLVGKSLLIDLGFLPIEKLKTFFGDAKEVTLKIENTDQIQIEKYFDLDFNTWSLIKFNETIDKGKKICEELQ